MLMNFCSSNSAQYISRKKPNMSSTNFIRKSRVNNFRKVNMSISDLKKAKTSCGSCGK